MLVLIPWIIDVEFIEIFRVLGWFFGIFYSWCFDEFYVVGLVFLNGFKYLESLVVVVRVWKSNWDFWIVQKWNFWAFSGFCGGMPRLCSSRAAARLPWIGPKRFCTNLWVKSRGPVLPSEWACRGPCLCTCANFVFLALFDVVLARGWF